ncbi:arylsulfatase [Phormidium sp. LEGE 05292]|uniref:arylsulfatase B n=1 Tax=[Phormidium] sp. LEGE 05292 TaxID=767427 RepID=UPI001881F56F|nr:arylsulfatase [Phormidium sp. LEGE 05292]MBE9227265.1 arylsulfatase [Phormidium sp. LEGE 05292]
MKFFLTAILRKRLIVKGLGVFITFILVLFLGMREWIPFAIAQQKPVRPHILFIMSDDQGWKDVGFNGSDIKTPNLDRLVQTGARLEQYYAHPMCTPSRAALLTGRYPHRYGLQTAVIPSAGTYGLATDEWLLPQSLKTAGYKSAIVGKWHLGHADRKYWPLQRGFDYQYGPILGEIDYFTHSAHGTVDWYRNNQLVKEEGYVTTLLGQDAAKLIQEHDPNTPLFLYLAFTAPHAPYQAPPEYLDRYKSITDPNRRAYAAMITVMDDEIGRVLAALDKRGMRNNTLIVFQSDNGGPRSAKVTGEVDTSGGTIPADNGPFRDGKASLFEGGTRVVALANWPGQIKPGSVVNQPMHIVDWYPTLIGLAGAKSDPKKPLDGLDIWPALIGGKIAIRNEIVYGIEPFRAALRQGDWKLVWRVVLPSQVQLFNLAKDPSEKTNLADQQPEKVLQLKQQIEEMSRDAVSPLFIKEAAGAAQSIIFSSVATPDEAEEIENQP